MKYTQEEMISAKDRATVDLDKYKSMLEFYESNNIKEHKAWYKAQQKLIQDVKISIEINEWVIDNLTRKLVEMENDTNK